MPSLTTRAWNTASTRALSCSEDACLQSVRHAPVSRLYRRVSRRSPSLRKRSTFTEPGGWSPRLSNLFLQSAASIGNVLPLPSCFLPTLSLPRGGALVSQQIAKQRKRTPKPNLLRRSQEHPIQKALSDSIRS